MNIDYQLATLVALFAGFAFQWIREGRVRRWLEKDAASIAAKANADAIALASKVQADAQLVSSKLIVDAAGILDKLHASAEKIAAKVDESTATAGQAASGAERAYTEANGVNHKIADLSAEIKAQGEQIISLHKKIDHGTEQTNGAVHEEAAALAAALLKFTTRHGIREKRRVRKKTWRG